jgi:hypothetical protein
MTSEESSLPETLILNTSGKGARIFRFKMTDLAFDFDCLEQQHVTIVSALPIFLGRRKINNKNGLEGEKGRVIRPRIASIDPGKSSQGSCFGLTIQRFIGPRDIACQIRKVGLHAPMTRMDN